MAKLSALSVRHLSWIFVVSALTLLSACGGSNPSGGGGGGNPPSVPTGLTATAGNAQVTLAWTASSGATSYNVKRSTTSGGPYSQLGTAAVSSYLDSTVTNGTPYYYVVAAVNANGASANSSEASATPALPIPPVPTGLTATAGNLQVSLSWTASSGATSYHVKRGTTSGGPYTQVAAPTATSYTDSGLTNGTIYYYVVTAVNASGESGNSTEASATPSAQLQAPTGLTAVPGNSQVTLSWTAIGTATSYHVKRSTTSGGPYAQVANPVANFYFDTGLSNSTKYYYVVTAVYSSAESGNSAQVSATPLGSITNVAVQIDGLTNRHPISPYVYGGSYPKDKATVTDSGMSVVRWGGNGTSTYNWKLFTTNADNDYYFEDFGANGFNNGSDADSIQFVKDVKSAGGNPLMTMPMLPWVAQSAETSTTQGGTNNYHWSFSVAKYGPQCSVDQYNTDAGNGIVAGTCNNSSPTYLVADPNDAYFPLLDDHTQTCPAGKTCEYRNDWASALATAFGASPHFYDMDNEIDIWSGTHRDIHPNNTTFNELRDVYLTEARNLKLWDPQAIRFGPVSCCWYFYWRSATGASDTSSHGGVDFLPWWLNEVAWSDAVAGNRSLDVFDIHAYPDADTNGLSKAQQQALAVSIYRDWWDPTFASAAAYIRGGGFSNEPVDSKPFRLPRMRAIVNSAYPGTPLAITEWSAAFAGESDFSTALGDADAYGILGRERAYLASRWTAPDPANPNYLALKLYTNYDGQHHGFAPISVATTNTGDPNLFSSYAAVTADGKTMTLMLLNKDPANTASVTFNFAPNNPPTSVSTYTLTATNPTAVTAASPAWTETMNFPPYSATLLVLGIQTGVPSSEWDLNPDTTMIAAGGSVTLHPKITSGTTNVPLINVATDPGLAIAIDQATITPTQNGAVTISAPSSTAPGFYHFTVTGADGGAGSPQFQGGWIIVSKPAATLAKTGDNQTGGNLNLRVTLAPGSSGGTKTGASIFFTTDKGTLSQRIVTTDGSGNSTVTLTLPSGSGTATVTAEGPYGLGHPIATFTESN